MALVRAALCREDEHVGLSICAGATAPMRVPGVRRMTAERDGHI